MLSDLRSVIASNRTRENNKHVTLAWFEEKKSPDDTKLTTEELKELSPMPTIAMVATRGKDDPKDMFDYLGDKARSKKLDDAFKSENSNFRIVIVVDMWITGFDVPCLSFLYNDKPLQKQTLIQTISRVNRKYTGKEYGYIISNSRFKKNQILDSKAYLSDKKQV